MSSVRRFSEMYGGFIADHTFILLLGVIFISLVASYGNSMIKTLAMDQKDFLPKGDPAVKSMNYLEDEFGGAESALIVVELDSTQSGSNEVKDVRDPRVLEYVDLLAKKASQLDDVTSASSGADLIRTEDRISQSQNTINALLNENPQTSRFISRDYSMTLVYLNLLDKYDETRLSQELKSLIAETPHPSGVRAEPSGSLMVSSSIRDQIAPDMERTSQFALAGVLVLVVVTFSSIRYGLTSLFAIALGTMWCFGSMGLLGMSVTSQTSGAASMIMGIGIDFGIQVVSRFRIESKKYGIRNGMVETMNAVIIPMSTTTLAALIGFRAMSMGELTILKDLATIMSLGVFWCMMAALTIVPGALVLGERYLTKSGGKK
ncbi:MAG: MMPL family transporter [Candidatus Altiarchaeota archaeon]